jgi:transcription antitermination factor NusG
MEKDEGEVFAARYEVKSYPTYIFLDVSERLKELVHRISGTRSVTHFLKFGVDATDTNVRIGEFRKRYSEGNREHEFVKSYIDKLYLSDYWSDANEIAYWLYKELDWADRDSTDALNLIRFVDNINHPYYEDLIGHITSLEKLLSPVKLYNYLKQIGQYHVWIGKGNEDPFENYNAVIESIQSLNYSQKDKLMAQIQFAFFIDVDEEKFKEIAPEIIQSYYAEDWNVLNNAAWNFYENSEDIKELKQALDWVTKSVKLKPGYANMDTKMRLLYVLGKKKEAINLGLEISALFETNQNLKGVVEPHNLVMNAMKNNKDIRSM